MFSGRIFHKAVGILMGTHCASLLGDIYFYLHKADFIWGLPEEKRKEYISSLRVCDSYSNFHDWLSLIWPGFLLCMCQSVCHNHNHNPILSSFMTFYRISPERKTTSLTSGAGTVYPFGTPKFTSGFSGFSYFSYCRITCFRGVISTTIAVLKRCSFRYYFCLVVNSCLICCLYLCTYYGVGHHFHNT